MKKSSLVAMMLGTVSGVLFALGMCMALIEEWGAYKLGIVLGCVGLLLGLVTTIAWRKMGHKQPFRISGKTIFILMVGIVGVLVLGVGMCFCMVWGNMIAGIGIGLAGIIILLCLLPLIKGIKK